MTHEHRPRRPTHHRAHRCDHSPDRPMKTFAVTFAANLAALAIAYAAGWVT